MGTGDLEEIEPLLVHQRLQVSNAQILITRLCVESKRIWEIAGPSIFTRLAMFSLTVVTQSFAGHLSDVDLAAISICTSVIIGITFGFLLGMASALETLCGQAYGAKNYHMLGIYMQRSWVVLFISSMFMVPLFVFAAPLLKLNGQSTAVAELSGLVAIWLIPMHLSFGFQFTLAFVGLWEFFKLAVASGVMLSLENFYYRLLLLIVPLYTKAEVAVSALSVCITFFGWESMIGLGFFAAAGVLIANELGAGNAENAKFATTLSVLTSFIVCFFFWSITIAFPDKLAMIFTSCKSIITMVDELSVLLAFTILLNCVQPVLSGVAVGCGRQALVALINIGSYYLVGVPLGVIFGLLGFGVKGVWAGMISGTVVQTLFLAIITIRCQWDQEAKKAQVRMASHAVSHS